MSSLKEDARWNDARSQNGRLSHDTLPDQITLASSLCKVQPHQNVTTFARVTFNAAGPSPLNRDDEPDEPSSQCVWDLLAKALPRKEVIQPHLPVRLPCYDFVPVAAPALGRCLLAVSPRTSSIDNSHDVTGGVYKARVRIHRAMADTRLLATPPSWGRVSAPDLHWASVLRFASSCEVAALCRWHCSVCVAPGVRAMRT